MNGETVVLKIIAQVIQSNVNITNIATVHQTNYNPNPDNKQSHSTITVGKESDPTTDPSGEGNGVIINAKTVSMQNTGIPLTGLLLAILAIFCGLLPKKKQ